MALREPSEGSLLRVFRVFVLRVLRPGGCAAHLFEALQASEGTPHVGWCCCAARPGVLPARRRGSRPPRPSSQRTRGSRRVAPGEQEARPPAPPRASTNRELRPPYPAAPQRPPDDLGAHHRAASSAPGPPTLGVETTGTPRGCAPDRSGVPRRVRRAPAPTAVR